MSQPFTTIESGKYECRAFPGAGRCIGFNCAHWEFVDGGFQHVKRVYTETNINELTTPVDERNPPPELTPPPDNKPGWVRGHCKAEYGIPENGKIKLHLAVHWSRLLPAEEQRGCCGFSNFATGS